MKKEGLFGGGSTKVVNVTSGHGDKAVLKVTGGALTVSIGPGLPKNSSELLEMVHSNGPFCNGSPILMDLSRMLF